MTHTNVTAAIAERSRFFEQAYCAGDARALVEGYFVADAHGPLASPPGGSPLVMGRKALILLFDGMFGDMPAIRLETIEVASSEGVAFELGRAILTDTLGATHYGRYCVGWQLTADGWRAKTDLGSSRVDLQACKLEYSIVSPK